MEIVDDGGGDDGGGGDLLGVFPNSKGREKVISLTHCPCRSLVWLSLVEMRVVFSVFSIDQKELENSLGNCFSIFHFCSKPIRSFGPFSTKQVFAFST